LRLLLLSEFLGTLLLVDMRRGGEEDVAIIVEVIEGVGLSLLKRGRPSDDKKSVARMPRRRLAWPLVGLLLLTLLLVMARQRIPLLVHAQASSSAATDEEEEDFPPLPPLIAQEEEGENTSINPGGDTFGFMVCMAGVAASLTSLAFEKYQWNMSSFSRFSIATKVPVQVFCVSGPLVMVSAFLYLILALLLLMDGTREVFFIAASWTAICIDMSLVMYETSAISQIANNWIDVCLHVVNALVVVHTFNKLHFFPVVFMASGVAFWGVVMSIRVYRKWRGDDGGEDYGGKTSPSVGGSLKRHLSENSLL
jgi:hypothetical protein